MNNIRNVCEEQLVALELELLLIDTEMITKRIELNRLSLNRLAFITRINNIKVEIADLNHYHSNVNSS